MQRKKAPRAPLRVALSQKQLYVVGEQHVTNYTWKAEFVNSFRQKSAPALILYFFSIMPLYCCIALAC